MRNILIFFGKYGEKVILSYKSAQYLIRLSYKLQIVKKLLSYTVPVLICFVLGALAGRLQSESIENWYPLLNKSILTPPDWLFPVAWGIIYLLSGISVGVIWNRAGIYRKRIATLWGIQQLFNFTWSILFFTLQSPLAGFINIVLLDILVFWYITATWKISRAASLLFWPYMIWLVFASYLNGYIMWLN